MSLLLKETDYISFDSDTFDFFFIIVVKCIVEFIIII